MPSRASAEPVLVFGGTVVPGHGRGRLLGFPTANIAWSADQPPPPDGVYSCWVRFPPDPRLYGATVSVGDNPTFGDVDGRQVEAHLHDFDGNLYGRRIEVLVAARLRPMRRFTTVQELIRHTREDVRRSRSVLGEVAPLDLDRT